MDANLDKIAKDLYGKIQTRFSDIKIGDENAQVLSAKEDIPKARFFEFEYEEDGEPLGTIAITLDAEDGVVIQVSGDLTDDNDRVANTSAYKFIRSFRQFAKDRLLNFDVQNIGKSNLDKRDYEFQAKRKEEPVMPQQSVMESKMYGNNRVSYQDLGEARLIVKHSQPINIELPAGRTMHIESIYIENAEGERFKYPYKHLNGARALAEHIKHGGNPYDAIGSHICNLSEELASLRKFKGYVSRQEQLSEAMANVTTRVIDRIEQIKETISKLQRPAYYEEFAESFEEQEEQMIPETVQNDLIDRLTIRTFNEELKSVFPYIYKFVDESELPVLELGVDDLLSDAYNPNSASAEHRRNLDKSEHDRLKAAAEKEGASDSDKARYQRYKDRKAATAAAYDREMERESIDPEIAFESFMDSLVNEDQDELFSPNKDAQQSAIDKLNQIMSQELKGGPDGINAIQSLKGLIDDPVFLNTLKDVDPDLDTRSLIQQYVTQQDPNVAVQLSFGSAEEEPAGGPDLMAQATPTQTIQPTTTEPAGPSPEELAAGKPPVTEPTAAPAPVAESKDEDDVPWEVDPKDKKSKPTTPGKHGQGYSQARHLARQGMQDAIKKAKKAGATLETQIGEMTLGQMIEECGMQPSDFGFEQPVEQGLPAMLKYVSGFYNRESGNFPLGGQRIKIKVKKAFEDGEFGHTSPEELHKVLKFIDHKDPTGGHDHEQHAVLKLAGVNKQPSMFDTSTLETQLQGVNLSFGESLARIIALAKK